MCGGSARGQFYPFFLYSPKFNVKLNVINKYVSEVIPINKCSVVPKMSRVC